MPTEKAEKVTRKQPAKDIEEVHFPMFEKAKKDEKTKKK